MTEGLCLAGELNAEGSLLGGLCGDSVPLLGGEVESGWMMSGGGGVGAVVGRKAGAAGVRAVLAVAAEMFGESFARRGGRWSEEILLCVMKESGVAEESLAVEIAEVLLRHSQQTASEQTHAGPCPCSVQTGCSRRLELKIHAPCQINQNTASISY